MLYSRRRFAPGPARPVHRFTRRSAAGRHLGLLGITGHNSGLWALGGMIVLAGVAGALLAQML
jgi:hypothetical protein